MTMAMELYFPYKLGIPPKDEENACVPITSVCSTSNIEANAFCGIVCKSSSQLIILRTAIPAMIWQALLFVAVADAQISAGLNHLRFGCSQLTIERLDPLVNPGLYPTPHSEHPNYFHLLQDRSKSLRANLPHECRDSFSTL